MLCLNDNNNEENKQRSGRGKGTINNGYKESNDNHKIKTITTEDSIVRKENMKESNENWYLSREVGSPNCT